MTDLDYSLSFAQTHDLVELIRLDPSLRLDIRYATAENFLGYPVYEQARAFLQRPAAEALVRVHQSLAGLGYGLVIFDGYRPWQVTRLFWQAVPPSLHRFVADPATGSRHNRGCAVDLSLVDLNTGQPVTMPSEFDEMTERSHIRYDGGSKLAQHHRDLLERAMNAEGFAVYEPEWWHYDYHSWQDYPLLNLPFAELGEWERIR